MKRVIALVLLFVCLAPTAWAERLDDSVLLSYYDNSIFFGDSIMQGFRRYRSNIRQTDEDFLTDMNVICTASISLYAGSRRNLYGEYHFRYRGVDKSMYQITKELQPDKIFILLGLNDPVGIKIEKAITWIEYILTHMPTYAPDTEVYFFSLTPVTPTYCRQKSRPKYQEQVDQYNQRLRETCEAMGAGYVEIAEYLKGEDGYLKAEYSSDNVCHLSDEGVAVWIQAMCDYAQSQYDLGLWMPVLDAEDAAQPAAQ